MLECSVFCVRPMTMMLMGDDMPTVLYCSLDFLVNMMRPDYIVAWLCERACAVRSSWTTPGIGPPGSVPGITHTIVMVICARSAEEERRAERDNQEWHTG